jgi:hypothetical protein
MPKIILRRSFLLTDLVTNALQSFTVNLNSMVFSPDEMIIKGVAFHDSGLGSLLVPALMCDFLPDPLCVFAVTGVGGNIVNCQLENSFTVTGMNLKGLHTFTIFDPFGTGAHLDGGLSIQVEFIKYK